MFCSSFHSKPHYKPTRHNNISEAPKMLSDRVISEQGADVNPVGRMALANAKMQTAYRSLLAWRQRSVKEAEWLQLHNSRWPAAGSVGLFPSAPETKRAADRNLLCCFLCVRWCTSCWANGSGVTHPTINYLWLLGVNERVIPLRPGEQRECVCVCAGLFTLIRTKYAYKNMTIWHIWTAPKF